MKQITFPVFAFCLTISLAAQKSSFQEVATISGLAGVNPKRITWADFNGDGWPDLLVGRTRIYLSHPAPTGKSRIFREVVGAIPERVKPWNSIALPGDVNNDGNLDIFLGVNCDFQKPKVDPKTKKIMLDKQGKMVPEHPDDGRRNMILLGDGQGKFKALEKSGLEEPPGTVCAATFLDFDKDGHLDLFVGHWYREYGQSLVCYADRLFRGNGTGRFTDVTTKAGLLTRSTPGRRDSSKPTFGAATSDWNNDGWTDILVCTYGRQWNMLWRNNGDGTFTEVGASTHWDGDSIRHGRHPEVIRKKYGRKDEMPFRANGNTFDVAVGDIDNDCDFDLFSAEITHFWAGDSSDLSMFLCNLGAGEGWRFRRDLQLVPPRNSLPWKPGDPNWNQGDLHSALFDYDNDGWLDLVIGASDYPDEQFLRLYRNGEGKGFTEVTAEVGLKWRSPAGLSFSDFDRDGRLDLVCGRSHMRLKPEQRRQSPLGIGLWHNQCGRGNHWLVLRLVGAGCNRSAIGARVEIVAGGRRQIREVQGGAGHAGHANDTLVHFGLGRSAVVDLVQITWPDRLGSLTSLVKIPGDRYLTIRQARRK